MAGADNFAQFSFVGTLASNRIFTATFRIDTQNTIDESKLKKCLSELKPLPKFATVVTALHYGANNITRRYFATKRNIRKAQMVLVHALEAIPVQIKLQSSDNADLDFCTLVRRVTDCCFKPNCSLVRTHCH